MKSINLLNTKDVSAEDAIRLHYVAKLVFKSRRATVLTGAGISCNAGIPDFRSDDGLYNIVKAKYPTSFIKGQDLFDISLFRNNETLSVFCTFMEGLYTYSLQARATETHRFIKTLKEKNKLLRCYTQNIDSLEKSLDLNCGIDLSVFNELEQNTLKLFRRNWLDLDVVQLHGDLHKLSCTQCHFHYEWTPDKQLKLKEGEYPECDNCYTKYQERLYSGKRLTGRIGILRPNIVLYGENHPQSEILAKGLNIDIGMKCDLLLIMGTSLKVDGVKKLVRSIAKGVRDRGGSVVFVNKTPAGKQWNKLIDYEVLCDCDDFVRALKMEIPDLFLAQEQLDSKRLRPKQEIEPKEYSIPKVGRKDTITTSLLERIPSFIDVKEEQKIVLTPPSTPQKIRTVLLPRLSRKSAKKETLPSPSSSFSEMLKVESDVETATDTDVDEVPLKSLSESTLNRKRDRDIKKESFSETYITKRVKLEV